MYQRYFHKENQTTTTTDIQQNFNGDFKIGKLRNRVLVGLDYFNTNIIDNGSGWAWARNVTPQGDVNYVDPFSRDTLAPVYLTQVSVDNLLAPFAWAYNHSIFGYQSVNWIGTYKHNAIQSIGGKSDYLSSLEEVFNLPVGVNNWRRVPAS